MIDTNDQPSYLIATCELVRLDCDLIATIAGLLIINQMYVVGVFWCSVGSPNLNPTLYY